MPAPTGGHSALHRLIAVPLDEFACDYWGSRPLLSRAADLPKGFGDLFSNDAVDELVSRRGLRTPFLRVAKNGTTLADSAFTAGGGTGAGIGDQVSDDKLLRLFADGSTLVLQGLGAGPELHPGPRRRSRPPRAGQRLRDSRAEHGVQRPP